MKGDHDMSLMTTLTRKPLNQMEDIRTYLNRVFEDVFSDLEVKPYNNAKPEDKPTCFWRPSVEAYEKDDHFIIKAALPGIEKDQINIEVEEDRISISGERKSKEEISEENLYRSELCYGRFERSFTLGKVIDVEKVNADYKDGLLTIQLPKKEDEKAKVKKITLS